MTTPKTVRYEIEVEGGSVVLKEDAGQFYGHMATSHPAWWAWLEVYENEDWR